MSQRTKVFISYSHNDEKWLKRLQVHLKPLERAGHIDRWDDSRIDDGDVWRNEIQQALDAAQVAILLVSADFMASDFIVEHELPRLLAAAETKGVVILCVIVAPSLFEETPVLSRFQTVNNLKKPLIGMRPVDRETLFVKIAKSVLAAIDRVGLADTKKGEDLLTKPWNVPHERNFYFTGREAILNNLHASLKKERRALLSGLGGMGKTQIAIEYAYRHRDEYNAVLWVTVETKASLTTGYADLARVLGLPQKDEPDQEVIVEAVKAWFEAHDGWLLVFDSANNPEWLEPLWPHNATGHLLITSRARQAQNVSLPKGISTNRLSPEEALEFLLKRTGSDALKAPEQEAAKELAYELSYMPLALEQAAYLVQKQAMFQDYLKSYRAQGLDMLEKAPPVVEGYRESVAKTWLLNFQEVEAAFPAAADLLRSSAFLAPDNIPLEIFTEGAHKLGPRLAEALADIEDDPAVMNAVLAPLTRYSLIRRDVAERTFTVHSLVHEVVRASLDPDDRELWEERAILAMNAAFPNVKFENWPLCERLLPHALVVAQHIRYDPNEVEAASRLLEMMGWYLLKRAKYDYAESLFLRALDIREKLLGVDNLEIARSLNSLALLYKNTGRYVEAEPLFRRALTIREKLVGSDQLDTADSLNGFASLLRMMGRYEEAESSYRRALEIREMLLGPDHPETARSLNSLALLFTDTEHYAKAERLYKRALEIREQTLGPNHPDTAITLNNLGVLLYEQQRYDEAEPLYRRALDIDEQIRDPDHPAIAFRLNNLARLYRNMRRYEEAEPLFRRALKIREQTFGPIHPDIASSLIPLALLLHSQGHYDEAESLFRRGLNIAEETLGAENPRRNYYRKKYQLFLRERGREDEAAALEPGT